MINEIEPGSFHSKIGLMKGDRIKKINGKDITSMSDLMLYMADPETVNSAIIVREKEEMKLSFNQK